MADMKCVTWPNWPQYGEEEFKAVDRVIRSGQIFAATEVKRFEAQFAEYQATDYAVAMGNATQGLHLALAALNVGEGDEVIVTTSSWISTASCILMQNAVPVFCDIESESLALDPGKVEELITPLTKAIITVHILGYPSRIQELTEVAKRHSIPLVEDASHAPGATVDGKKMGTFGALGVFSLHQRKAVSTGDGGVICTDDGDLAEKIRRLRSFGHDELSYNYRMTEFAGALGQVGLAKLDRQNKEREQAARYLAGKLAGTDWVRVRLSRPNEVGVYYAVAIEINLPDPNVTRLFDYLVACGFPMRKAFAPLNRHTNFNAEKPPARGFPWLHPGYQGQMKNRKYADLDFPVAYEYCYGRVLELYTHPGITQAQMDTFVEHLVDGYNNVSAGTSRPAW